MKTDSEREKKRREQSHVQIPEENNLRSNYCTVGSMSGQKAVKQLLTPKPDNDPGSGKPHSEVGSRLRVGMMKK